MRLSNPLIWSVRVSASRASAAISAASASKSSSPPCAPPQPQRGRGGFDDCVGAFVCPCLAAAAAEKRRQAGLAEAFDLDRVGVPGQKPQRGQRHIRTQRGDPRRPEDLQQRITAGHARGAPMHQPRADLDRPLQLVARAQRVLAVQPLRVQKGKPGKHFGVEPISLGVLVVVITQISGLLGWHHHHRRAVAAEPGRQRDPGVAGRLHHHLDPLGVFRQPRPQRVQLVWVGAKPVTHEQESSLLVCQRCLMRSTASYVDSQANFQSRAFPYRWIWLSAQGNTTPTRSASTRHSLSGIRSSPPTLGHRVLNRAHDPRCGTRPPTHSTRQKSARALLRLSYRGDGRAPANSV
jgi:hypothetical protein